MKKKSFIIIVCSVVAVLVFSVSAWAIFEKTNFFDESDKITESGTEDIDASVPDLSEEEISEKENVTDNISSAKDTNVKTEIGKYGAKNPDQSIKVNEPDAEDIGETVPSSSKQETSEKEPVTDNTLSANDQKVKTEIAKYNTNAADFRYNKKEIIANKNFDLTFEKVGYLGGDEKEKITYKNSAGDVFVYNLQSGRLFIAKISSLETKKGADSIDSAAAKKIALSYANTQGATADYNETYFKENDRGYTFVFSRFINGYRTAETIQATVGFNGEIVDVRNNTGIFEGKNISFNENSVKEKIDTELEKYENAVMKDTWLDVYNGKVVLNCQISFKKNGHSSSAVAVIPIE